MPCTQLLSGLRPPSAACWSQSPAHLAHPIHDDRAVVVHALGPSLQWSGQNRGELCCLLPPNVPSRGSVVNSTRRLYTINARAPFDHVEVELQNALLAEDDFGHRYQRELCTLTQDRTAGSEKQVLHELLREGGSS